MQLVKKFLAFHGTRRFITALTSVRHLSLSWASPIQSIYPHPTSCSSTLILSTHLRLGLPIGLLPSSFPHQDPLLTLTRHMSTPSQYYHVLSVKVQMKNSCGTHLGTNFIPRREKSASRCDHFTAGKKICGGEAGWAPGRCTVVFILLCRKKRNKQNTQIYMMSCNRRLLFQYFISMTSSNLPTSRLKRCELQDNKALCEFTLLQ